MVKNPPAVQQIWVSSLSPKDPLEKEMAANSSILAREIHGQRSLAGYSPWGPKELDMTFTHSKHKKHFLLFLLLWSQFKRSFNVKKSELLKYTA